MKIIFESKVCKGSGQSVLVVGDRKKSGDPSGQHRRRCYYCSKLLVTKRQKGEKYGTFRIHKTGLMLTAMADI
jgi:hypothetical protein